MGYESYDVVLPDGWRRIPGVGPLEVSHWVVTCACSLVDDEIVRLLIAAWYRCGIVLDAHVRMEPSPGRRIQYRVKVEPPFGESVCTVLTQWRCSDVKRAYHAFGNHTEPPPQMEIPRLQPLYGPIPRLPWFGVQLHELP
jgi:hypothetical protein